VSAILIAVGHIVDQVRAGSREREGDERKKRSGSHVGLTQHPTSRRRGENQQVLAPLLWAQTYE
jgi:hypothetical protein